MTLTIQTAEDSQRQLTLTIGVDEKRVQETMRDKARSISREVSIPGFRPGKAPYEAVVRRVGAEALRAEAIEDLIQPVFEEAMAETGTDMYGRPSLDDIESSPLVFKFTVPLNPVVTLGDYRALRKEVEDVSVTDEAVQEALEFARDRRATAEPVDRPAALGDLVTLSGLGTMPPAPPEEGEEAAEAQADETIFREEQLEVVLESKNLFPGTPFADEIVGMSVGEQKSFKFTFTGEQEYEEELAGREASFEITLLEVKQRELPALDDEFAKGEGPYETLDELRDGLRKQLMVQAEESHKQTLIDEMTDLLMENATLVYPPAAVDMQIDDMVEDFKNRLSRSGWNLPDYLQLNGMTEEAMREDFHENAENIVRRQLVLRQLILDERIKVELADVESLIEERVSRFTGDSLRDSLRSYYRSGPGFDSISSEALMDKVYNRTKAILRGEAPDLDAAAATTEEAEPAVEESAETEAPAAGE